MNGHSQITFIGTAEDEGYLPALKPYMGAAQTKIILANSITTWTQAALAAKQKGSTAILTTHPDLLKKLCPDEKDPKISNYAGSYFSRDDLEVVILNPLQQLRTVSYGGFLAGRYISKLLYPDRWMPEPEFSWEIANESTIDAIFDRFSAADLIALDTETTQLDLAIRCVGYCAVWLTPGGNVTAHTVVLPMDKLFWVTWMRKFNRLPGAKILQNGKYDHAYFFRYNAPCTNWLWDTKNCMHAWYSELPKDLGFIGSFFRRHGRYWKDLAQSAQTDEEYYLYNARDCYNTAMVFLSWIREVPVWAKQNYLAKFPVNFPSHMGEMRGIAVDMARRKEEETKLNERIATGNKSLETLTASANFNSNSPKQVKELLCILGCKDIAEKSSNEKSLNRAMYRHSLNRRVLSKILDIRGDRKLVSTYLPEGKFLNGRLLFGSHPDGTDTGRGASAESPYWCGYNIQNVPAYTDIVKRIACADNGFAFAEADFKQAETRGTAYLTGDSALLKAIGSDRDFHSLNASSFFGLPYESIYDDSKQKTLNKPIRNVAKRVNHGANYLMMEDVLIETMGLEAIFEAGRLLGLPSFFSERNIASHLLQSFERTYPTIRDDHPREIIAEIKRTRMLVGPTGWTRYCFGDPEKSKLVKNSYTAHRAQSLNAMILDKAVLRVFYEIALHPEHGPNFKFIAQIHDSIFFMYRIGCEYICDMVAKCMEIPVEVTDIKGITRTMVVPVDIKKGTAEKPALYWADCGD